MKKGWEIKRLGDVCDFQNGFAFKSNTYKEKGLPIIRITNIKNNEIDTTELVFFEPKDYKENLERFKVFKGDILIAMSGATTGKIGINNCDTVFYLNQRVGKFLPRKELDRMYLFYFLSTKIDESLRIAAGAAQPNLSTEQINSFEIPLPALSEQKRIVAKLDKAFAAIDKAIANTEKNLQNVKELFESYLEGVFEDEKNNWHQYSLIDITTKIGSGATPRGGQESYKDSGISLVRSMNVHDLEFRDTNLAFIDEKQAKELDGVTLQENDVLLNITGASVARCCVFPKAYLPARVNQHVSIIRLKKDITDARFLNLLLCSRQYKNKLLETGEQGSTRQAITKVQIESFHVAIPDLKKQQAIVNQIDALISQTQKLKTLYQSKLTDLEELKKSMLEKAFARELKRDL